MRFDFYLPEYNTFIEYDGVQHFKLHNKYTPTNIILEKNQERDIYKTNWALQNNYKLIRICYLDMKHIEILLDSCIIKQPRLFLSSLEQYNYITKRISVDNDSLANLNLLKI